MSVLTRPAVIIAAPSSGSGKSTLTVGLMAAFSQDRHVQAFKIGPDYIDPMYHQLASGNSSINLDSWMLDTQQLQQCYGEYMLNSDIGIIEGVMGLFDGIGGDPSHTSTAEIAVMLGIPVILVIDGSKMAGSAAAMVYGFNNYCKDLRISGVIFNRVTSENHKKYISDAMKKLDIPILGFIPKNENLRVPERHLGLFTAEENLESAYAYINTAREMVCQYIDLKMLDDIANKAKSLQMPDKEPVLHVQKHLRLAVAKDSAFCFYYADNLTQLRKNGIEIVYFSPIHDTQLPENIQGIYFGGGYPELYALPLSNNRGLIAQICAFSKDNGLIFGECGGLMYLTEGIHTLEGKFYPMTGLLPGVCQQQNKLTIGYRSVSAIAENWLLPIGETIHTHEFHYSSWTHENNVPPLFHMFNNANEYICREGAVYGNLLATYNHVLFRQDKRLSQAFVHAMEKSK